MVAYRDCKEKAIPSDCSPRFSHRLCPWKIPGENSPVHTGGGTRKRIPPPLAALWPGRSLVPSPFLLISEEFYLFSGRSQRFSREDSLTPELFKLPN